MEMTDVLARMGGLQSMARELGLSESQAASGASAMLPAVLGGFKKQAQAQASGVEGLGSLLGRLGGGSLLDNVLAPQPTDVSRGNDVLGQIFGTKEVSRTVAQTAANQSGVGADRLKKMLPMLAMAVAGYLAKQRAGGGAAQPAQTQGKAEAGGGLGGLLGGLLGGKGRPGPGGGITSMLDLDGDGNPLDDILRMAARAQS